MGDLAKAQRGRWAVGAFFGANGFVMGAWAPQIPLILPRLQITESVLGLLILILGIGAVCAMLFSGRLITRFGSRRIATSFALASVPVLPLVVLAPSVWLLGLIMAAMGAIVGCMDVAMNSNAVLVERRLGRPIMSSSHGFWSLGGFFGGSLGSIAIAYWGPMAQAVLTSGVALGLVLWGMTYLYEGVDHLKASTQSAAPKIFAPLFPRDLALWLLGFLAMASMIPEGAVLDWAAIYLGKDLGSGLLNAGMAYALFSGAMATMRFMGDSVRHRFGGVNTLRVSGAIGAGGMMLAALAPNDILAIMGFALSGLGVANMVPILFSAAGNHPNLPSGQALSIVTMVGYAGILVAPASIGFVAEHLGFRLTYGVLALLLLLVAALAGRASAADDLRKPDPAQGRTV